MSLLLWLFVCLFTRSQGSVIEPSVCSVKITNLSKKYLLVNLQTSRIENGQSGSETFQFEFDVDETNELLYRCADSSGYARISFASVVNGHYSRYQRTSHVFNNRNYTLTESKLNSLRLRTTSDTFNTEKSSVNEIIRKLEVQIQGLIDEKSVPGPQGPQGPQGPPGPIGPTGECPDLKNLQAQFIDLRDTREESKAEIKMMREELNSIKSYVSSINAVCVTTENKTEKTTCTCKTGFKRVNGVCSDINECNTINDCDQYATCTNTEGSYQCVCLEGFSGDGKTCQENVVLALCSYGGHKAMLISQDGSHREPKFDFKSNTEVHHSCSVVWQDKMYVFGGTKQKNQISEITDCSIKRLGDLQFNFVDGDCVVAAGYIYLCFNIYKSDDFKRCRKTTNPLGNFEFVSESNHVHRYTRIAASKTDLFALGSYGPFHNKAETFKFGTGKWTQQSDYPYNKYISHAPVIQKENSFLIFGGYFHGAGTTSVIAKFHMTTMQWSQAGSLNHARHAHGVIKVASNFLVIGGRGLKSLSVFCGHSCFLQIESFV